MLLGSETYDSCSDDDDTFNYFFGDKETCDSVFEQGARRRRAAFGVCVREIRRRYADAVNERLKIPWKRSPRQTIPDMLQPIRECFGKPSTPSVTTQISAEQCATVAICILYAWTQIVRIVDWDEPAPESRERKKRRKEKSRTTAEVSETAQLSGDAAKTVETGQDVKEVEGIKRRYRPPLLSSLPEIMAWE